MENTNQEIWVVYPDGALGVVYPEELQSLIESREIIKFQRSDGWVYLTIDPVRSHQNAEFPDTDRRRAQTLPLNQALNF